VGVPVWQVMAPSWQGLLGVQLPPAIQMHVPPLHTLLLPHDVPSATFPVAAQTDIPVAHEVAPIRHGLAGWQLTPAVQETQLPV
jgi:hypothetical protein